LSPAILDEEGAFALKEGGALLLKEGGALLAAVVVVALVKLGGIYLGPLGTFFSNLATGGGA